MTMVLGLSVDDWLALLAALAIPLVLGVAYLLWRLVQRAQRRRLLHTGRLQVVNLGNAPASFDLRLTELDGQLEFQLLHEGTALYPSPAPAEPNPASEFEAAPMTASVQTTSNGQMDQLSQITSAAADGLRSVGNWLPSELRSQLAPVTRGLEQTDTAVRDAQYTQLNVSRALAPGAQNGAPHPPAVPAPDHAAWVRTPPVEPGATLALQIVVTPRGRVAAGPHHFQILSRPVECLTEPARVEPATLTVRRLPWLWRTLPAIILIGAVGLVVACLSYLAFSFGFLG